MLFIPDAKAVSETSKRRQGWRLSVTKADVLLISSMVLICVLIADFHAMFPGAIPWLRADDRGSLGAEYGVIAESIYRGDGFSDPFNSGSGATAWMPPLFPYMLASLYYLMDGNRTSVVYVILLLQSLSILTTGLLVVSESRRLRFTFAGYAVVAIVMAANFRDLFQQTHDIWLVMLLINLAWLGLNHWASNPPRLLWGPLLWGSFGGLAALASPVVGTAWAVLTAVQWFPKSRFLYFRSYSPIVVAAVASMIVVTPWTIRNYRTLGQLVPIKSNSMYELWQSQCSDDDGLWDEHNARRHPFECDGSERQLYVALGEMAFMDLKGKEAKSAVLGQPAEYLRRVGNRIVAATIWYQPFRIVEREWIWILVAKRIVYGLPWVALIMCGTLAIITRKTGPQSYPFWVTICLISLFLLPYVLLNFYARYAVPLIGLKMLLLLYAIEFVRDLRADWSRPREHVRDCDPASSNFEAT